jgi:hypothetical protein
MPGRLFYPSHIEIVPVRELGPELVECSVGMPSLLMGRSVNHHRPPVPFRDLRNEQLQR